MTTYAGCSGGTAGSWMTGSPLRPRSPLKRMRFVAPPSVTSSTTCAEPRMCPASMNRALTPGKGSNSSS